LELYQKGLTDPVTIKEGESAVLSWSSSLADTCEISPDVGAVDVNGSITVSPAVNCETASLMERT